MVRGRVLFPPLVGVALFVQLHGALAQPAPPAPPAAEPPKPEEPAPPPASPPVDKSAEARAHFEKGVAFFRSGAIDAALAELLESRRLLPTKSATEDIAICLRKLQRFDEALTTYESLIREFPDLPADTKAAAQREIVELRGLVGTIEITSAEVGAAVTIDGRSRGDYPLIEPPRVAAGSHTVRVHKEGFEPFETRVDVAGGKLVQVAAPLRALKPEQSGRLQVIELGGRQLDVLVDGVIVGTTPRWEGSLPVGNHTVALRGEGELGTQPVRVPVKLRQVTPLSLAAEPLGGLLQIKPTPAGASVTIDSVAVGRGIWEGRLREGAHQIEVADDGFLPVVREIDLPRGKREVVTIKLERDPSSVKWRRPGRFFVELGGAGALSPSFGGIGEGCGESCALGEGLGAGAYGVLRGGYTLGSGFGFGLSVGALKAVQRTTQQGAEIDIVGDEKDPAGTVEDTLTLSGFLGGAWAGVSFGERFPLRLRLGTGVLLGSITDSRTGSFGKPESPLGRRGITRNANFFWVDPEARVGLRLGDHFELTAGVEALILASLSPPKWEKDTEDNLYIYAGKRGAAAFPATPIVGRAMIFFAPGVSVSYAF